MSVSDISSNEHIVLEGDVYGIIHSFLNVPDSNCHPLFRGAWLLKSSFTYMLVQYTWREGVCALILFLIRVILRN